MLGYGCHKNVREDKVKWTLSNVSSELDSRRATLRDKVSIHDFVIIHVLCLNFSVVSQNKTSQR